MSNNLIAFGTIFAARGCALNYLSATNELEIVDGVDNDVDKALQDIALFEDTANHIDCAAALALASQIDGARNPLSAKTRNNILTALHVSKDGKFIYQVLSLQKNNRAWHLSNTPYMCSHFDEMCTHRGVRPDPERKGRTSSREPNEYHPLVTRKRKNEVLHTVAREQLVTPALNRIFQTIPDENLISGEKMFDVDDSIRKLKGLDLEGRLRVIRELESVGVVVGSVV